MPLLPGRKPGRNPAVPSRHANWHGKSWNFGWQPDRVKFHGGTKKLTASRHSNTTHPSPAPIQCMDGGRFHYSTGIVDNLWSALWMRNRDGYIRDLLHVAYFIGRTPRRTGSRRNDCPLPVHSPSQDIPQPGCADTGCRVKPLDAKEIIDLTGFVTTVVTPRGRRDILLIGVRPQPGLDLALLGGAPVRPGG